MPKITHQNIHSLFKIIIICCLEAQDYQRPTNLSNNYRLEIVALELNQHHPIKITVFYKIQHNSQPKCHHQEFKMVILKGDLRKIQRSLVSTRGCLNNLLINQRGGNLQAELHPKTRLLLALSIILTIVSYQLI